MFSMYVKGIKRLLNPQLIVIVSMGMPILIGAGLLMLPWASRTGQWTDALTALFTATSAMCVTGHTLVDTGSYFSHFGQMIILILFQIGGLGFMTMAMALLIIAGRRFSLRNETALSISMGMSDSRAIKSFLLRTVLLSLVIELCGAVIFALYLMVQSGYPSERAFYHGIFHSVSAFCNAGFSLCPDGLIGLRTGKIFLFTVIVLVVLGGMGFLVLSEIYHEWRERRKKHLVMSLHSRMVISGTLFLIIAGWIGFALLEWHNTLAPLSTPDKVVCALFQSVTPRTAGFNVVEMAHASPSTRFMTLILMFIGGSPGSTAGGVKTTTTIVLIFATLAMIRNQRDIVILGRTVSAGVVGMALSVFILGLLVVLGLFGLLLVTEHNNLVDGLFSCDVLLFDAVSAFGTVGLCAGAVPLLTSAGKLILVALMFIGRVGPLTLALFIGMKDQKYLVRYPNEDVIIG